MAVAVRAHWILALCMLLVGILAYKFATMRLKHKNHPTFDDLVASHMLGGKSSLEDAVRYASVSQAVTAVLGAAFTILTSAIICLTASAFRHNHARLDDILSYIAYACILVVLAVLSPILRNLWALKS